MHTIWSFCFQVKENDDFFFFNKVVSICHPLPCNFLWSFWEPCAELIRKPFEFHHCNKLNLLCVFTSLCHVQAQQVSTIWLEQVRCEPLQSKSQLFSVQTITLHFPPSTLSPTNLLSLLHFFFFTMPEVFLALCSKCCLKKKEEKKSSFNFKGKLQCGEFSREGSSQR